MLTGHPVQGGQQRADVERSPGLGSEVPGASKTWRRSRNKRQSELVSLASSLCALCGTCIVSWLQSFRRVHPQLVFTQRAHLG